MPRPLRRKDIQDILAKQRQEKGDAMSELEGTVTELETNIKTPRSAPSNKQVLGTPGHTPPHLMQTVYHYTPSEIKRNVELGERKSALEKQMKMQKQNIEDMNLGIGQTEKTLGIIERSEYKKLTTNRGVPRYPKNIIAPARNTYTQKPQRMIKDMSSLPSYKMSDMKTNMPKAFDKAPTFSMGKDILSKKLLRFSL